MVPPLDADALAHPTLEVVFAVAHSFLPGLFWSRGVPAFDIEDLVHDVVLIAQTGLDHYDPGLFQGGDQDPLGALKAWLTLLAWRRMVKDRDRAHRRREVPSGGAADLPVGLTEGAPSSEQVAMGERRFQLILELLQKLRPARAEILIMHDFLGMSAPEIALELDMNVNTVRSRLLRARGDFQAAAQRLPEHRRSLLEEELLLLPPLGPDRSDFALEERRWPRLRGLLDEVAESMGFAAGAAALLVLAMCAAAVSSARAARAEAPSPIVAVREVVESDPSASPADAPALSTPAVQIPLVVAVPTAVPGARRAPGKPAGSAAPPGELGWLDAARRALNEGNRDRALARLDAHQERFPRGAYAEERERVRRLVVAKLGRDRTGTAAQ